MRKKNEKAFHEKDSYIIWKGMKALLHTVLENGELYYDKDNRSAGRRCRLALHEVSKLKTQLCREMVAETKD